MNEPGRGVMGSSFRLSGLAKRSLCEAPLKGGFKQRPFGCRCKVVIGDVQRGNMGSPVENQVGRYLSI